MWAALCGNIERGYIGSFRRGESYEVRARRGKYVLFISIISRLLANIYWRVIGTNARAQWDALPQSYRLHCNIKTCDRRLVDRDFIVNMKLNYLYVHFLLWRALLRQMPMDPTPELFTISKDMLGLVVEAIMLKDKINLLHSVYLNSGDLSPMSRSSSSV
jgi:hypothetical protein